MIFLWILLGLLLCFLLVVFIRALLFKPLQEPIPEQVPIEVNVPLVTAHFQDMLRLKTISNLDDSLVDLAEFQKFQALLPTLYPTVYAKCEYEQIGKHGILLHLHGQGKDAPTVLMAHYDVVPVVAEAWDEPAFEGLIKDGELWGRGTLDTKGTLLGILESAELLLKQGFVPQSDVYFAFGGDEECMGSDAVAIVDTLFERGIHPALVLDEGGAIVEGVFPGVKESAALIGIAEKGNVFVDVAAKGKGGHASAPPAKQSVGVLAKALSNLESHAMPFTLTAPALKMFDLMGRNSTFGYRLIFANLWCFAPLLNLICKKSGGELNALVRTTCALTRLSASDAYNVLPTQSKAGCNLRIICGESIDNVKAQMEKIIDDDSVKVTVLGGSQPSSISPTSGAGWERVVSAIRQTYPGVLVSPYLMLAGSDSRHYCKLCNNVYRFSGMPMSKEQRGMIHNHNERIRVNMISKTVQFFAHVLEQC